MVATNARHQENRMQTIATKIVQEIKDLPYKDKLKDMKLSTLKDRWERDLITMYKLMNNIKKTDRQDLISLIEDGGK